MDISTSKMLLAASGGGAAAAAAAGPLYVDDVFSTYLYHGTQANKTITNGIDLAGEGGMVWIKARTDTRSHFIFDTERGVQKRLITNGTFSEATATNSLTQFNNNGFNLGDYGDTNKSGHDMCAWSFRKAPGFFDVVTYTGNGTAGRTVAHNLGSVPGMIIIKRTDTTDNWAVYHRSLGNSNGLNLDTYGAASSSPLFNNTTPTSTEFTVNNFGTVNASGSTYVAYVFAHDDASFGTDEDESIIKCGSYTGTGINWTPSAGPTINLGFEPQWLMVKRTDSNDSGNSAFHSWIIQDNMRGLNAPPHTSASGYNNLLFANLTAAEGKRGNGTSAANTQTQFLITPTGFTVQSSLTEFNGSGATYIYMAIRRPNKPPTVGTEVFAAAAGNGSSPEYNSGFPVDMALHRNIDYAGNWQTAFRLTNTRVFANLTNTESALGANNWDYMDQWGKDNATGTLFNSTSYFSWMFKRAPGFFDVVAYTGTNSNGTQAVSHNLEATPELIIVKNRSTASFGDWRIWSSHLSSQSHQLKFSTLAEEAPGSFRSQNDSSFTVGYTGINQTGVDFISYLFATLPGISKVGSYSGSSSAVDVDCGFTNGARFVLIKRTDQSGNWFVFDTTRGIVSGNDPALWLNSTNAPITNTDYIDPLSSGFTVTTASGDINESGGTYIFLAIA